jgi:hypothetical protein
MPCSPVSPPPLPAPLPQPMGRPAVTSGSYGTSATLRSTCWLLPRPKKSGQGRAQALNPMLQTQASIAEIPPPHFSRALSGALWKLDERQLREFSHPRRTCWFSHAKACLCGAI